MHIYSDELDLKNINNKSIALLCPIVKNSKLAQIDKSKVVIAGLDVDTDQIDIYPLNSILVSTGWNGNDDVFSSEEIWAAKNTPVTKQFNFMHDEKNIIGVITNAIALDTSGEPIDNPVDDFDIATSAIIYKVWSDEDRQNWIDKLIEEIETEDKWAVSMECIFGDFDYAVVDPNGNHKVIARNKSTSFLTKHLRAYGGNGVYQGYKIGRKLKQITFSGKGLVDNPAGPRSVILNNNPFKSTASLQEFKKMSEDNKDLVEGLKKELADSKAALETMRKEITSQKEEEYKTKIEAFNKVVEDSKTRILDLEQELKSTKSNLENVTEDRDGLKKDLDKVQKDIVLEKRCAELVESGISKSRADAFVTLEKFQHVDDNTFSEIVNMLKEKNERSESNTASASDDDVDDVDEDDVDEVESEEAEASLNEDVDDIDDEVDEVYESALAFFRSTLPSNKNVSKQEK